MQDIYNRKNYTMIPRVSVCIKTLFTLKKQLRCNLKLVNMPVKIYNIMILDLPLYFQTPVIT